MADREAPEQAKVVTDGITFAGGGDPFNISLNALLRVSQGIYGGMVDRRYVSPLARARPVKDKQRRVGGAMKVSRAMPRRSCFRFDRIVPDARKASCRHLEIPIRFPAQLPFPASCRLYRALAPARASCRHRIAASMG